MDINEKVELIRSKEIQYIASGYVNENVKSKNDSAESKYYVPATFSDETVDRYGDVILASAYNTTKNFERFFNANNVLLWSHNKWMDTHNGVPLGNIIEPSFTDKRFDGIADFRAASVDAFAAKIFELFKMKTMKAFSVGFRPIVVSFEPVKENQDGWTFLEVELLEVSAVPIPANPNALAKAVSAGVITNDFVEQHFKKFVDQLVTIKNKSFFLPSEYKSLNFFDGLSFKVVDTKKKEEAVCTCKVHSKEETKPEIKADEHKYHCRFCGNDSDIKFLTEEDAAAAKEASIVIPSDIQIVKEADFYGEKFLDFECPACGISESESLEIELSL